MQCQLGSAAHYDREGDPALRCFDRREQVECDGVGLFTVYTAGFGDAESARTTVAVCLHGAGHAACSWALCAKALKAHCRVIAMDLRGHGSTVCLEDADLSLETLHDDLHRVLEQMLPCNEHRPSLVLIGHSMGGALAVHVAARGTVKNIRAVVLVEASEGVARESFDSTITYLNQRPRSFPSTAAAVEWVLESGLVRNRDSALVSIPCILRPDPDSGEMVWRSDISTQARWSEWFSNMSQTFLLLKGCAKLVVMAHPDGLDRDLMLGQMQGLFQLELLPPPAGAAALLQNPRGAVWGHFVHEDHPDFVAAAIIRFLSRQNM